MYKHDTMDIKNIKTDEVLKSHSWSTYLFIAAWDASPIPPTISSFDITKNIKNDYCKYIIWNGKLHLKK